MVEKCPICLGNGLVPEGFYTSTRQEEGSLMWTSGGTGPETCRACGGKGYVVIDARVSSRTL